MTAEQQKFVALEDWTDAQIDALIAKLNVQAAMLLAQEMDRADEERKANQEGAA